MTYFDETDVKTESTVDTRIEELRSFIADAKSELRSLVKLQEKATAQADWVQKVGDLNEAQLEALEEALKARATKAQKLSVEGIESQEVISEIQ